MKHSREPSTKLSHQSRLRRVLCGIESLEDRRLLTADLVSVTPGPGAPVAGSEYSSNPTINGNGRYVAFQSHSDDLTTTPDTNGTQDVFVRDLWTGTTTLISRNADGTDSAACESTFCGASITAGSFDPDISDDGRFIAFVSYGTDLTVKPIESGTTPNVFLHDRDTDENGVFDESGGTSTRLLSIATDGDAAGVVPGNSTRPVISGNGRSVAFVSGATDMAIDVSVPLSGLNAFLATRDGGLRLINVNSDGSGSGVSGTVIDLSINEVGGSVAFTSSKADLVSEEDGTVDDTNGAFTDIFIGSNGAVEPVSVNATFTGTGDLSSRESAISGDGRHVAFFSRATDLAAGITDDNGFEDLYVRDLKSGVTTLVSRSREGGGLTSGDGPTPPSALIDGDILAGPHLSDSGRFIVFRSSAGDLLDPGLGVVDDNEVSDIFRYDRDPDMDGVFDEPGETLMELVSINATGTASAGFGGLPPTSAGSSAPSISSNGRYVSFVSTGIDIMPGVVGSQVYVRDMTTGVTSWISETSDGFSAAIGLTSPATRIASISGDGSQVAFQSARDAADLDPSVTDPPNSLAVPFSDFDVFAGTPPTDIRLTRNFASGFDTHLQAFNILFEDSVPFGLSYYLSSDPLFDPTDDLLATVTVSEPTDLASGTLSVLSNTIGEGTGEIALPGAGAEEPTEDYFILVVADPSDAVSEFDSDPLNEDNTMPLRGLYHLPGGSVLVQAGDRNEEVAATVVGETLEVSFGLVGGGGRTFTYGLSEVTDVRVRTHDGNDRVFGSDLVEVAFGGPGKDRLLGAGGDDELLGGLDGDLLDGGPGDDLLDGGPGPDTILGGLGDDILFDGPGDDLLDVGLGDDTVVATPGSDDIFIDGGGIDTLDFSFADQAIDLDLDLEDVAQVVDEDLNTIELEGQWENLVGSPFDDTFYIDPIVLQRILRGGDGSDKLIIDVGGNTVVDDGSKISFPNAPLGDIVYEGFEFVELRKFAPFLIDDEDLGYSSTFTHVDNPEFPQGFNGDIEFSGANEGNTATWTFDGIPNGSYLVSTTWTNAPDRAKNAPYEIFDGDALGTALKQIRINQEVAPREFNDQGVSWNNLAAVTVTGNQLTVELGDEGADEFVIADAVRIEPLDSEIRITDNLDSGFSSNGIFQNTFGTFGGVHATNAVTSSEGGGLWQFNDLPPGTHLVSATWPSGLPTAATNASFSAASGTSSFTTSLNQAFPPADFAEGGIPWKHLGLVEVDATGSLNVELTGSGGVLLADAIRVAPQPTFTLLDSSNNPIAPGSTIDLGQVAIDPTTGLANTFIDLTIQNTGNRDFTLLDPILPDPFTAVGFSDVMPPNSRVPLEIGLTTDSVGEITGTLQIPSVGTDLFQFALQYNLIGNVVADSVPPTVSIASPGNEATLVEGSTIAVQVDATDDVGLKSVELLVNESTIGTLTELPFEFEVILPNLGGPGTEIASIVARGLDVAGNVTDSSELIVNLVEDLPPTVNIVSPEDGAPVLIGSSLPILVEADDDVQVGSVQLLVNGQVQETLLSEPFLGTITVPETLGTFDVSAIVQDDKLHSTTQLITLDAVETIGPLVGRDSIITGASQDQPPRVRVLDPNGNVRTEFFAYSPEFLGGVRVSTGDINDDGIEDIIAGAGPGSGPQVRVFDGTDGSLLDEFFAFDPSFTGGVFVAGGDVSGDGIADIIVANQSQVRVFSGLGSGRSNIREFNPFPGSGGGIFVAAGDVNGDGQTDIVTGAGPGGQPQVKVFDSHTNRELSSFLAYDSAFTGGVRVATGDVNGDGFDDIITGAGPGGDPHVRVFDGLSSAEVDSFFAFDTAFTGGVFVGSGDATSDGVTDILVLQGGDGPRELAAFNNGRKLSSPALQFNDSEFFVVPSNSIRPEVFNPPTSGGTHELSFDNSGQDLVLTSESNELFRWLIDTTVPLRINSAPAVDDLLIFNPQPIALPRIVYDGGTGGNDAFQLNWMENQEPASHLGYAFQSPLITDLIITFSERVEHQVQMIDLEPIIDNAPAVDRTFVFPATTSDQIIFDSGVDENDNILRVDSDNSEVVHFVQPSDTVTIESSPEDAVAIQGDWQYVGSEVSDGKFARVFSGASLTLKLIGPDHWSNPINSLDTNADGAVSPIDALLVINELNSPTYSDDGPLFDPVGLDVFPDLFFDISRDGFASAIDALIVINFLNQQSFGEGEGPAIGARNEFHPVVESDFKQDQFPAIQSFRADRPQFDEPSAVNQSVKEYRRWSQLRSKHPGNSTSNAGDSQPTARRATMVGPSKEIETHLLSIDHYFEMIGIGENLR